MANNFSSETLENVWDNLFPNNAPAPKSLIEISGAPGTGKSIVLQELMARALLMNTYSGYNYHVLFLDLTHKFHLNGFIAFLENLMKRDIDSSHQPVENRLTTCCESLICLDCYSSEQFEFVFEEFDDLLSNGNRFSLIAIDGLDSFYWDECINPLHYINLLQSLKILCQQHNICCAYTVDEIYVAQKAMEPTSFFHPLIDYKLQLTVEKDGRNYINDSPIQLNYDGVKFL